MRIHRHTILFPSRKVIRTDSIVVEILERIAGDDDHIGELAGLRAYRSSSSSLLTCAATMVALRMAS